MRFPVRGRRERYGAHANDALVRLATGQGAAQPGYEVMVLSLRATPATQATPARPSPTGPLQGRTGASPPERHQIEAATIGLGDDAHRANQPPSTGSTVPCT
jgi:hypothetical protein